MSAVKPRLSIIIPSFNSESCIKACLSSIAVQSWRDFEICIQDGGSTDNTIEVISQFGAENPGLTISLNSKPDTGIYDAMNQAVSRANGDWLYFLGTDDSLYNLEVLQRAFNTINADNSIEFLYGNVFRIHARDIHFGKFNFEKLLHHNICHQSIFLRKSTFLQFGPFDPQYRVCADWALNLKLYKADIKLIYADFVVSNYNESGFSSNYWDMPFYEYLDSERKIFYSNFFHRGRSFMRRVVEKLSGASEK